jgi:broad specificity phosphatase PhoE
VPDALQSSAVARVLLVRHAAVDVEPARPASGWQLSERGRADALRLASWPGWRDVTTVVSSDERKAAATAEPIAASAGVPLLTEPALREVDRGATPVIGGDAYAALVRGYLGGGRLAGWEPRGEALARAWHAVLRATTNASGTTAIVSHGLLLSVYLNLRGDQWERIELPAVAAADVAADGTPTLERRFLGVDELLRGG